MDTTTLAEILGREVAARAGKSPAGRTYFTASPDQLVFALIAINIPRNDYSADAVLMARIAVESIIIELDLTDKPLIDGLVQAGISREQIILAYAGEPIPTTT